MTSDKPENIWTILLQVFLTASYVYVVVNISSPTFHGKALKTVFTPAENSFSFR